MISRIAFVVDVPVPSEDSDKAAVSALVLTSVNSVALAAYPSPCFFQVLFFRRISSFYPSTL